MSTVEQDLGAASRYGSLQGGLRDDDEYVRKRRRTVMACTFCRGRKIKCDGAKPLCANCNKRKQPCHYAAAHQN